MIHKFKFDIALCQSLVVHCRRWNQLLAKNSREKKALAANQKSKMTNNDPVTCQQL